MQRGPKGGAKQKRVTDGSASQPQAQAPVEEAFGGCFFYAALCFFGFFIPSGRVTHSLLYGMCTPYVDSVCGLRMCMCMCMYYYPIVHVQNCPALNVGRPLRIPHLFNTSQRMADGDLIVVGDEACRRRYRQSMLDALLRRQPVCCCTGRIIAKRQQQQTAWVSENAPETVPGNNETCSDESVSWPWAAPKTEFLVRLGLHDAREGGRRKKKRDTTEARSPEGRV